MASWSACRKIVIPIEIGEQPGLTWGPTEPLAGARARSGRIQAREHGEAAEMSGGFLARLPGERHAESTADQRGDTSKSRALFCDGVVPPAPCAALERQSANTRRITAVHVRPPVVSFAHYADTPFSRASVIRRGTNA